MPDKPAPQLAVPSGSALPLAQGDLSEQDALELRALKTLIRSVSGLDCEAYKEPCLRRRLAVRMRARGIHRYGDYGKLLTSDGTEAAKLLDAITINVSKFFRNREVWESIRTRILPGLFRTDMKEVRIWSAGCASGEEPYTIAMLLMDYATEHRQVRSLSRFRILATDIDVECLVRAARGEYGPFAFTEIDDVTRARFFEGDRIRPEIQRMVTFKSLNLVADELPREQHLIFCRNVIIYFERPIQAALFTRFHQALLPGGHLVLGKVETVFGHAGTLFRPVISRERIFVRV